MSRLHQGHLLRNRLALIYDSPLEFSLAVLEGKWTATILTHLILRPLRYGELRSLIPTLSEKVLSERLSDLQERYLVTKTLCSESPQILRKYALTPHGLTLASALKSLDRWGASAGPEMGIRFASTVIPPGPRSR